MAQRITVYREYLDRGGYSKTSGRYFGVGGKLWCGYYNGYYKYVRAADKTSARVKLEKEFGI